MFDRNEALVREKLMMQESGEACESGVLEWEIRPYWEVFDRIMDSVYSNGYMGTDRHRRLVNVLMRSCASSLLIPSLCSVK